MARIRSVHPGLFTDEAFVSCSAEARLFAIGIWTECDDQGVFEWKPLTLKMRLAPADNIDPVVLLEELSNNGLVHHFDISGRHYGVVRNFRKYQRPKKPNATHPLPDEYRAFVGLKGVGSEPVPHQLPTATEKSPQMEDGGGRREDEGRKKPAPNGAGRATRLQADWILPDEWLAWAIGEGWHADSVALEADKFRDYWIAAGGQKARKADWFATWRNWMRNSNKGKTNGISAETQPERSSERVARATEILRKRDQENLQGVP